MTPSLPPQVARVDQAVVRDLAAWGIPTPPVTIRVDLPAGDRYYRAGVSAATADARGIHLAPTVAHDPQWPAELFRILAHERLHAGSAPWGQPGSGDPLGDVCREEAAADAVSMDMVRARYGRRAMASASYPEATRWLRLASTRATGAWWTTPTATAWRITYMRATVTQRAALTAGDPEPCPTTDFQEATR